MKFLARWPVKKRVCVETPPFSCTTVAILLYSHLNLLPKYIDPPHYPYKTTMVANEKKDVPRICIEESTAARPHFVGGCTAPATCWSLLWCSWYWSGKSCNPDSRVRQSDQKLLWNSGQACPVHDCFTRYLLHIWFNMDSYVAWSAGVVQQIFRSCCELPSLRVQLVESLQGCVQKLTKECCLGCGWRSGWILDVHIHIGSYRYIPSVLNQHILCFSERSLQTSSCSRYCQVMSSSHLPGQEWMFGHPGSFGVCHLGDADAHHDGTQGQGVPQLRGQVAAAQSMASPHFVVNCWGFIAVVICMATLWCRRWFRHCPPTPWASWSTNWRKGWEEITRDWRGLAERMCSCRVHQPVSVRRMQWQQHCISMLVACCNVLSNAAGWQQLTWWIFCCSQASDSHCFLWSHMSSRVLFGFLQVTFHCTTAPQILPVNLHEHLCFTACT